MAKVPNDYKCRKGGNFSNKAFKYKRSPGLPYPRSLREAAAMRADPSEAPFPSVLLTVSSFNPSEAPIET